ncbi:MAG: hypothetical protein Q9227_006719 [Pyrenula ochraceoflavens]
MASRLFRLGFSKHLFLGTALLGTLAVVAAEIAVNGPPSQDGPLDPTTVEERLQACDFVKSLNQQKAASSPSTTSFTSQLFALLFPSSPAINSLLATLYISGPPSFLLALCPPNIDPSSLSIMVAFAVGGLLGDTLFHLLPEIFLGEDHIDRVKFVMLEPNRNLLLGVGIMAGFLTFVAMDKALRIATGGEGHEHQHSHATSEKISEAHTVVSATGKDQLSPNGSLTHRPSSSPGATLSPPPTPIPPLTPTTPSPSPSDVNPSVKLSGLLNLIADFTHNITDGLALSSSFYASKTVGATTTVAIFFHEVPHQVGDFALLIQSGFGKKKAIGAQFVTALGALLGTVIGIVIQESGGSGDETVAAEGIFGTSLSWGDMLLPFTAGTFLYVGTVAVIPELLETGSKKGEEVKKTVMQFLAMFLGAGIMLGISWS